MTESAVDSIKIRGNSAINGATSAEDSYTHLMSLSAGLLCGAPMAQFLLTYAEVTIDCPECVRKLKAGEAQGA